MRTSQSVVADAAATSDAPTGMTANCVSDKYVADMLARPDGKRVIGSAEFRALLTELQSLRSPVTISDEMEAWVGDYLKSDGTKDYFVMIGCGGREMSVHMHRIRGRAEYEAAEINWLLKGGENPDFEDFDCDGTAALVPAEQEGESLRDIVNEAHKNTMARPEGRRGPFIIPDEPTPCGDNRGVAVRYAVQSATGSHIGMWSDEDIAGKVFREEYPDGEMLALVHLSSLEDVERERDEALDANAQLSRQLDQADPTFSIARAETAEASLAALVEFVHRWTWVKEGNGTSDAERLDVLKHYPPIAALAGSNGE